MPSTGDPIRPVFLPRGVADVEAATGYVSDLAGRVVAIDLGDGAEVWRSGTSGRPILAAAGRVFVLGLPDRDAPGVLRLEVLDATSGRRTAGRAFELAGAPPGPHSPEELELSPVLDANLLRIEWRLRAGYAGGAPPPDHVRERQEATASGQVEYDLGSDRLVTGPAPGPPHDAAPELPSWPYRRDGAWRRTAWAVNDAWARLVLDEARIPPVLTLELWNRRGTERTRADDLLEGSALEPTVTTDGRHLFLRRTAPTKGRWLVFEAASGRRLAALPYVDGSRLPSVLGERAVYLLAPPASSRSRGAALHAVRMASGRTLWTHSLAGPATAAPPPLPG